MPITTSVMSCFATSVWIADTSVSVPRRSITSSGCAAMFASSVIATPIVLLPTSRPSARTHAVSGKIKALQGGLQGLGADRDSYLLPQIVGETSGMRGEGTTGHLPSRNVRYRVARGKRLVVKPKNRFGHSLEPPCRRQVAR